MIFFIFSFSVDLNPEERSIPISFANFFMASPLEIPSISETKLITLPLAPQPKQWYSPFSGLIDKDGVFLSS